MQRSVAALVNVKKWTKGLATGLDDVFASWVTQGLQHGFVLGLTTTLTSVAEQREISMKSANDPAGVITSYCTWKRDESSGK